MSCYSLSMNWFQYICTMSFGLMWHYGLMLHTLWTPSVNSNQIQAANVCLHNTCWRTSSRESRLLLISQIPFLWTLLSIWKAINARLTSARNHQLSNRSICQNWNAIECMWQRCMYVINVFLSRSYIKQLPKSQQVISLRNIPEFSFLFASVRIHNESQTNSNLSGFGIIFSRSDEQKSRWINCLSTNQR